MNPLYTGKGDDGTTGYLGKGRLFKDDMRIETLGSLDECSAQLGIVRNLLDSSEEKELIKEIQRNLYQVMAEVASDAENAEKFRSITTESVRWLEEQISSWGQDVKMPQEFILPGDTLAGAELSYSRALIRKAERRIVEISRAGLVQNSALLQFMNRLSTLLYILEIRAARDSGSHLSLAKEK